MAQAVRKTSTLFPSPDPLDLDAGGRIRLTAPSPT
jgi:hypothetical protein